MLISVDVAYCEFWDGQNPNIIGDCTNYDCNLLTAICSLHLTNLGREGGCKFASKFVYTPQHFYLASLTILAMDIGGRLILLI